MRFGELLGGSTSITLSAATLTSRLASRALASWIASYNDYSKKNAW
jgi:hypothetical protein